MKKKYYCVILLIFFGQNIFGQAYLDVPHISQKNTNWCWAASIQMVLKYYNNNGSITQCDILKQYLEYFNTVEGGHFSICDYLSNTDCMSCLTNNNNNCNNTLNISWGNQFVKKFFEDHLYNIPSITNGVLDWDTIKNQIDNCQPIIIIVNRTKKSILDGIDTVVLTQHCVVIDGYLENECDSRYLLIKDPWNPCSEGCSYALNYDSLSQTDFRNSINSVSYCIYDLKPKSITGSICDVLVPKLSLPNFKDIIPCTEKKEIISINEFKYSPKNVMKKTLTSLLNCFLRTLSPSTGLIKKEQLDSLKRFRLYVIAPEKIANPKEYWKPFEQKTRYLYHSTSQHKFQAILQRHTERQITTMSTCPTNSIAGYWYVDSFGVCSYLCPNNYCRINTNVYFLISYIQIPIFQVVLFTEFGYTFRRFRKNDKTYYYSLTDYKDLKMGNNKFFQANVAYSAQDVLYRLHKKIIQPKQ